MATQGGMTQGWVNEETGSMVNCARVPPKEPRQQRSVQFPDLTTES